jgi:uncharacterized protein
MSSVTHVSSARPRDVFERLQRVIRANDAGSVADLMAEDGVIEWPFAVPTAPQRLEGRDEIREYVTRSPVASLVRFDDLSLTAIHETLDPEVIVLETTTCGTVAATGRRFELPAIAVLRIRGGEIVSYRDYVNPLAAAQVTGRLPQLFAALTREQPTEGVQ